MGRGLAFTERTDKELKRSIASIEELELKTLGKARVTLTGKMDRSILSANPKTGELEPVGPALLMV